MKEEKKMIPKLRFPGFDGEWEKYRLGDIGTTYSGLSGKTSVDFGHGDARFITYMNVYTNALIDPSMVEPIEIDIKQKEVEVGDVFFTTSSETPDEVGMSSVLSEKHGHTYLNSFCFGYRPAIRFDLNYLAYLLRSEKVRKDIVILAQGISRYNISKNKMMDIKISVPSILEQEKIGSVLKNFDTFITLHQQKLEKLKEYKQGMLQKMFPKEGEKQPEIRFPGFEGDWEHRKLSDIVDVLDGDRGKNYPTDRDFSDNGHTLFLNASNVRTVGFSFEDTQYISEEKSNSMGNGKLQEDDLVITSRGSLGHIAWYNADIMNIVPHARINSGMLIFRKRTDIQTPYLYQFMKSHKGQGQISFMSFGSAQPQLTKKGVENLEVIIPYETNEQKKIADYFCDLDTFITLHQQKLEKMKEYKKGLLQQMFV